MSVFGSAGGGVRPPRTDSGSRPVAAGWGFDMLDHIDQKHFDEVETILIVNEHVPAVD
jgi:hypothetical protein